MTIICFHNLMCNASNCQRAFYNNRIEKILFIIIEENNFDEFELLKFKSIILKLNVSRKIIRHLRCGNHRR